MTRQQIAVLQVSVLIVALCGIVYELLIATVSSYLLGDSVRQFSVTIGLFMASMGLGAYLTKFLDQELIRRFIVIEMVVALIGGISGIILFAVFPFTIFYQPVMYGLIIVIGALVGMEIPILTRILSEQGSVEIKKSLADVLSLDYLGALVGSIAFPLFLLPFLGLFRASFVIGLINAVVAGINILIFRRTVREPFALAAMTTITVMALVAALLQSHRISAFAESQLYAERIVYKQQTKYQKIIVTRDEDTGMHRLFLDGHIQFAEVDEYRYHEALVHPIMSIPGSRAKVLILGGGDGMAAREVLKYADVELIHLVDIDPAMTELCATFAPINRINRGALTDNKVTIFNLDAMRFVGERREFYDRIIIDLPDPHNEALNKLYSVEFYKMLRARLAPGGRVVTQSTSPLITRNVFWSIAETLRAAGLETFSYQVTVPSFSGNWGYTLAAPDAPVPDRFEIDDQKTKFLTSGVMERAGIFGKDQQPAERIINSLFEPRLYLAYNKDSQNW